LAFSYWIDYLGFINEGKLAAIFIKPSLGVSNWPVIYYTFPCQLGTRSFLSPLPGIEEEAPTSSSPRHHGVTPILHEIIYIQNDNAKDNTITDIPIYSTNSSMHSRPTARTATTPRKHPSGSWDPHDLINRSCESSKRPKIWITNAMNYHSGQWNLQAHQTKVQL
jgi:hypothetical protein